MKVELLDHMGSDLTVANAARVSFSKESDWGDSSLFLDNEVESALQRIFEKTGERLRVRKGNTLKEADVKIIKFLARHNHWTPFGHCTLQFRIKAPIFVARQLVKHQIGLVWNEESRRYISHEPEFYFPDTWRAKPEGSIKQGSGAETIERIRFSDDAGIAVEYGIHSVLEQHTKDSLNIYNHLLAGNVAPEQARMILPLNTMTEWWWTGSLAAFVRVCKLRLDPHAQAETREIAEQINALAAPLFPVAWQALLDQ